MPTKKTTKKHAKLKDATVDKTVEKDVDYVQDETIDMEDTKEHIEVEADTFHEVTEEEVSDKQYPIFIGLRLKDRDEARGFTAVVQSPGAVDDMWSCAIYDVGNTLKGVYTMHKNAIWVMYEPNGKQEPPKNLTPEEAGMAADRSDSKEE